MKLESLKDLYLEQLRDLYSAETQLVDELPKLAQAAHSPELAKSLNDHLRQTRTQVQRLETIFRDLDEDAKGQTCAGMKGLIKEAQEMIKTKGEPEVIDAGLIASAQRVEHYEIAGYGTVCTYAEMLGYDEHHRLLGRTLEEEKEADEKLTHLAASQINADAVAVHAQPVR
jgi:ferritin-like metal-binding protein YciE